MLIAIDIGNSLIKCGFFKKRSLIVQEIESNPLFTASHYAALIRGFMREKNMDKTPEGIIISSVVRGRAEEFSKMLKRQFSVRPFILDYTKKTGIRLDVLKPEQLGTDRLANIVAAQALCKCPVAVVDFGTATTISVAGEFSNYMGGAILPGIRLMNKSLAMGTSRLSEVRIVASVNALGNDTASAIRSGLLFGTAGAVERIIGEIEEETGLRLKIFLTGGCGRFLTPYVKRPHRFIPYLTLHGLKIVFIRNTDA